MSYLYAPMFVLFIIALCAVVFAWQSHNSRWAQLRRRASGMPPEPKATSATLSALSEEVTLKVSALLDHNLDGWWDWNIVDNTEYMSPRFWDILGYDHREMPADPSAWMALIHPDDLPVALANFDLHVKTRGEHPYWQKVRYTHADGHEVVIICRGAVVEWGPADEPLRMIGTHVLDIPIAGEGPPNAK